MLKTEDIVIGIKELITRDYDFAHINWDNVRAVANGSKLILTSNDGEEFVVHVMQTRPVV